MAAEDSQGRYVAPNETMTAGAVSSAARTSSSSGTAFATDDLISLTATLNVTNRSGTNPTLDVELQTSGDGGSTYEKVDQFTQVTGGVPTVTVATQTAGTTGVNEVQTVTLANADGGTFTLTYSGQTTAAIAYNAAAAAVQSALEALSNIAPGDALVTGSAGGPYSVEFAGALAETNVAQMTASAASLSATDLTPEVKVFGPLGSLSKWAWTIGGSGTPTLTFSVSNVSGNRDN